jgi:hypothetical protein
MQVFVVLTRKCPLTFFFAERSIIDMNETTEIQMRMQDLWNKKVRVIREYEKVYEDGVLLATRLVKGEVVNLYKVGSRYAITYYSPNDIDTREVEWLESLTMELQSMISG